MAYTKEQAKRIRKQYRRIAGAKPKGPKTADIKRRRAAVQRGDSSYATKEGKVVRLTRGRRLRTMERVLASDKKPSRPKKRPAPKNLGPIEEVPTSKFTPKRKRPARPKKPTTGKVGLLPTPKKRTKPKLPTMTDDKGRNVPRGPTIPFKQAPVRRRNRRKTR